MAINQFLTFILGAMIAFQSSVLYAIDGYKELKFGLSKTDVRTKKLCTIGETVAKNEYGFEVLTCFDLPFAGRSISASFIFIKNKLSRIVLNVSANLNDFDKFSKLISEKYGKLEASPDSQALIRFASSPDGFIDDVFDGGTIIVRAIKIKKEEGVVVIYTINTYDKVAQKNTKEPIHDL